MYSPFLHIVVMKILIIITVIMFSMSKIHSNMLMHSYKMKKKKIITIFNDRSVSSINVNKLIFMYFDKILIYFIKTIWKNMSYHLLLFLMHIKIVNTKSVLLNLVVLIVVLYNFTYVTGNGKIDNARD